MSRYGLVEVDSGEAPHDVRLAQEEHGAGLIVRHRGRLVGFALLDAAPGSVIGATVLSQVAGRAAAEGIVIDALRDELARDLPPAPLPSVTVAICTRDRPNMLERCLRSIAAARASVDERDLVREVLVVDNAPGGRGTADAVARAAGVRHLVEPRPGLDFARNAGWRATASEFVAYVDDDTTLDPHWIDGCARALRAHPDAGVVTGLVLPMSLATEAQLLFEREGGFRRGFAPRRWRGAMRLDDPLYPLGAGRFGAGCNMVIRRQLLHSLGGFDEALDTGAPLPGGGDLDLFYRALRAGAPLVYEPTMAVHHDHRRTLDELHRQYHSWGLGYFAFLGKVWQDEPAARGRVLRMAWWWTLWITGRLGRSLLGMGSGLPVPMIAAELAGAVQGAFGEYRRSQERIRAIRTRGR